MKLHLITFVITAFVLTSCGTSKNTNLQTDSSMNTQGSQLSKIPAETFWQLESIGEKNFSNIKNQENKIGFTLFSDNNRISGYSGCNHFFGSYKYNSKNHIKFSGLGATKMACPDSNFDENAFLNIFETVDSYRFIGDKIELLNSNNESIAVFGKEGTTTEPIVEKYWKLKTLEGKEVKMGKNQEREVYFILKTEDNRMNGFAGCNTISGMYKLEKGNRIHFSKIISTMMSCPDVDFSESEFLKVFELADNYTIKDDVLSLNVGRRAPLAVFEAVYMD